MSDADPQTPAPAADPAPAVAPDTTALEARIKDLQKDVENAMKGRAGAQKSAAASDQEAKRLAGELGTAQELLQGAQADLEAQKTTADATTLSLEETQARAAAAERQAKVLQLAGQVQPELVTLLTGAGVKIEVPGESDEDISNALKAFTSVLTKFHQPGAAEPAPQLPDTPGAPTTASGAPVVPGEADVTANRLTLMRKAIDLAGQPGQSVAMDEVYAQIEALEAG